MECRSPGGPHHSPRQVEPVPEVEGVELSPGAGGGGAESRRWRGWSLVPEVELSTGGGGGGAESWRWSLVPEVEGVELSPGGGAYAAFKGHFSTRKLRLKVTTHDLIAFQASHKSRPQTLLRLCWLYYEP